MRFKINTTAVYFFTLIVLPILVSSCGFIFPTYHKPAIPLPNQWDTKPLTFLSDTNLPYLSWWQQFNDPTLNQLLTCGLRANNTIAEARANIEKARGELLSVQLSWLPSLSFLGGISQNPNFGSPGWFYGLLPAYYAFNLFSTLAQTQLAQLNLQAQYYLLDATKLVFIGQLVSSYYTYIAQVEQLRLQKKYIKDVQELLDIQQEDYQGGINTLIPVEEIKQRLAQLKSQQHLIENNIIKSQHAIRYLTNQNPGPVIAGSRFNQVNSYHSSFATLPATVLANRPDVAYAETRYRLAVQDVGVAKSQLLPLVQLDYFYGDVQFNIIHRPVKKIAKFGDAYINWIINPSIFGTIVALKGARKMAYHNYIDTVLKALRDVADDINTHQKANERYTEINKAYLASQTNYSLQRALFKQDIIAYRDLLLAKLIVDEAALQRNEMKLIQMLAMVNLYQNLGGGYKADCCVSCKQKTCS